SGADVGAVAFLCLGGLVGAQLLGSANGVCNRLVNGLAMSIEEAANVFGAVRTGSGGFGLSSDKASCHLRVPGSFGLIEICQQLVAAGPYLGGGARDLAPNARARRRGLLSNGISRRFRLRREALLRLGQIFLKLSRETFHLACDIGGVLGG